MPHTISKEAPQPAFEPAKAAQAGRELDRRIVAHVAAGTADDGPETWRLSPSRYTDPARMEAEKRELFFKLPLMVALSQDIPKPGDVTLFEDLGTPVVIVRGRDGMVRAFLNMCRHRGTKVVTGCGPRKLFTCHFHGWSYDLDGRLVGVPQKQAFEGDLDDRANTNLISVPCCEWAGMIFLKMRPGEGELGTAELVDFLGDMAPQLALMNLSECRPVKLKDPMTTRTNWKHFIDTSFESYHIPATHPETFVDIAIANRHLYDSFYPHNRFVFVSKNYGDLVGVDESQWPDTPYQGNHFVFPNTLVFATPRGGNGGTFFLVYHSYPGATVSDSVTMLSTYAGADVPASTPQETLLANHDWIHNTIVTEDLGRTTESQLNYEHAPEGATIVLGRNEIALQDIHRAWDEALGVKRGF